jgi:hypothetical protein
MGVTAGVSIFGSHMAVSTALQIDRILDDGSLGTGRFIDNGSRYTFILEP